MIPRERPDTNGALAAPVYFVTSNEHSELTSDDRCAVEILRTRGITVTPYVWSDRVQTLPPMSRLVLRSVWDYHLRSEAFSRWLDEVERAGHYVFNSPSLVRWNIDKRYLADLQKCGVATIPTLWLGKDGTTSLRQVCSALGSDDIVLKPTISASALATHRVTPGDDYARGDSLLTELRRSHEILAQPYIGEITSAGEWSMMFFGGEYSHSVRKMPALGDFRVQVDFGGTFRVEVPPLHLREAAAGAVQCLPEVPLFVRIDGVEVGGRFLLMEAECIDPVLYFATSPGGVTKFVDCLYAMLTQTISGAAPIATSRHTTNGPADTKG